MLDIDSGENIEAQYKLMQIKGGKAKILFQSSDINAAINFHKNYVAKYKVGLYMEIEPEKKSISRKKAISKPSNYE